MTKGTCSGVRSGIASTSASVRTGSATTGPTPGDDVEVHADGLERQHDVGEEDRGVDAVPAHRLQGDLDDELGVHARLEHPDALADLAVLRQRAPGLAHEPDRRVRHRLTARRPQEGAVGRASPRHQRQGASPCGVFTHPRVTGPTYCGHMAVRSETRPGAGADAEPAAFRDAVASMRAARLRPEVHTEQMPAPQRIAPYAAALSADVDVDGTEMGTGRIILLHDPAGNDAWDGVFRCVAYARAEIDVELITDPLLADVGWSWLTEALDAHGAAYHAVSGTVTRVATESYRGHGRGRRHRAAGDQGVLDAHRSGTAGRDARRGHRTSRRGGSCSAPRRVCRRCRTG